MAYPSVIIKPEANSKIEVAPRGIFLAQSGNFQQEFKSEEWNEDVSKFAEVLFELLRGTPANLNQLLSDILILTS